VLPLGGTAPSAATLYNYDTDRDAYPGLLIVRGGSGATETDTTKYQVWRTSALTSGRTIKGTVRVLLWSGMKDFGPSTSGTVTVYLRDFDGDSYVEVAQGSLPTQAWQGGSPTWVVRAITMSGVDYTIPPGDYLELKLIVGAAATDDMWFAYDTTSYNSRLELP
jgi:hypothetical protein